MPEKSAKIPVKLCPSYLLCGVALTVVYFVSAKLGLSLSVVVNNVTLIWPPTGIALFALVTFGVRYWPWIFLGAFTTNITTGIGMGPATMIACGNTLEAVTAYYLLQTVGFNPALQRIRDVAALILLGAGISTMVSATLGAFSLTHWHIIPWDEFPKAWLSWWMGDALGDLLFASFLFSWWRRESLRWSWRRITEATLFALATLLFTQVIFGNDFTLDGRPLPLAFAAFPLLIWGALRFEMRGATAASLLIGGIILTNIILGQGLFAQGDAFESLSLFWLYMNVNLITGMIIAASVSERRRAEEDMRHLARFDALTGLPNRITLNDRINQAILHAERHRCQAAILFVDIDRFKVINDTLGHTIGDEFLIQAAERLLQSVRHEDSVTRHGGDEFVIVIDDMLDGDNIGKIASKILEHLREEFRVQGIPLYATASIGISAYPADGTDADTLLKHADIAMYRAKELGRNAYAYYSSEMNVRAAERLSMENELRGALQRDEFVLHYQPQLFSKDESIAGAEALLRWKNRQGQLVPPGDFIPLLEETGLIKQVGQWVLKTACEQLAEWHAQGWKHCRMAINISSQQINDPLLPRYIAELLARLKLPASHIELEITETLLMRQDPLTNRVLHDLINLGVLLAIDDFGTGYSSLGYLHKLSIDTLKIDRSFVKNIPRNEDSVAIARAIVGLAHSLDLNLIAEGIETREQCEFFRELKCQMMQGFLFSKPLPADQFIALLARQNSAA